MFADPCGDGWDLFEESCYKLFPEEGIIFYDALLLCADFDSHAATISSKSELVNIHSLQPQTHSII